MSLDPHRVCQVHARGAGDFGSGYLLTDTLVLTARHNVESDELPRVRPLDGRWVDATKVIRGRTADLALLEIPARGGVAPARVGRFAGDHRVACRALGFPRAQAQERARGTEEIVGDVAPATKRPDGLLTIHISGSVPLPTHEDTSPWAGYSGAAVFCGPVLAGVIRVDPANFGTDRLLAVPMTELASEPELCEALGGRPELAPVEGALAELTSEAAIANFLHRYVGGGRVFGGRGHELERLDAWLEDGPPYCLVTGLPGRGKSALLAEWYSARRTSDSLVYVPISIRYELNRELRVLKAIVTRLAALHGEVVTADEVGALRDALAKLVARRPPSGRAALIVDGLDEAADWEVGPALFPLDHDGGVKVLVSARLAGRRSAPEDWLRTLGWDHAVADALTLDALSGAATADVVARAGLAPEIAATVHDITAGDPLVVGLYVDYLRERHDREVSLAEAEPGLAGFMATWWEDQERQWGAGIAAQGAAVRAVWNVLACARGPLERRDLLALVRRGRELTGDDLDLALTTLERLVVLEPPHSYAVSHPRLGEFRVKQLAQDGDLAAYTSAFAEWGLERVTAVDVPAYVVLHLREHLEAASAAPEVLLRLADPSWELAWDARAGDTTGFVADVEHAWSRAAVANRAAVAAGGRPPHVDGIVWCAYLLASRLRTLSLVGPDFVAELRRHDVWSEARALDHVERLEPFGRVKAVAAIAAQLSARAVPRALALITGEDEADGRAVGALLRRLAELGDVAGARAEAERRPPGHVHACAVLAILEHVPADEQPDLVRSVLGDADDHERLATLERLTTAVDLTLARRAFGAAPDQVIASLLPGGFHWWYEHQDYEDLDPVQQGYALSLIGRWLAPDELERRLAAVLDALAEHGGLNVSDAIIHLAPLIPASLLARAERAIDAQLDAELGAATRIALAVSASPAERERLLAAVDAELGLLLKLGGRDGAAALAAAAALGRGSALLDLPARRTPDVYVAIAPQLDEPLTRRALAGGDGRDDGLKALLGRLASFGPGQAREALAIAAANQDADLVGAMRTVFAHAGAAALDVPALGAIEDPHYRLSAVAAASRLAPVTAAGLSDMVPWFGNLTTPNPYALDAFDVLHRSLDPAECASAPVVRTLEAILRFQPCEAPVVIGVMRRMIRSGAEEAIVQLASDLLFEHRDTRGALWALVALAGRRDALEGLAGWVNSPVVRALLLDFREEAEAEHEWAELVGGMTPGEVELRASTAALVVEAMPARLRERTARALVPDELLDGKSTFSMQALWASHMIDLLPALELDQVRRLAARASARGHDELTGACAGRIAGFGALEEALELLGDVRDGKAVAGALAQCLDVAATTDVPRLLLLAADRLELPWSAADRATLWARAGRRVDDLGDPEALALLDAWLERRPERDALLLDQMLLAGPIARFGGDLAARLLSPRAP